VLSTSTASPPVGIETLERSSRRAAGKPLAPVGVSVTAKSAETPAPEMPTLESGVSAVSCPRMETVWSLSRIGTTGPAAPAPAPPCCTSSRSTKQLKPALPSESERVGGVVSDTEEERPSTEMPWQSRPWMETDTAHGGEGGGGGAAGPLEPPPHGQGMPRSTASASLLVLAAGGAAGGGTDSTASSRAKISIVRAS